MAEIKQDRATSTGVKEVDFQKARQSNNVIAFLAPVACIVLGYVIWRFVLGNASGFAKPDYNSWFWPQHRGPLGSWHRMYEGGIIVPILIGLLFMVLVFSIERYLTISKAMGRGSNANFVRKVQYHLSKKEVEAALAECNRQKGSVGNVMRAGLLRYREMIADKELTTKQKVVLIKKEVEEATALEIPMMQKNLIFLSTITSLATLIALLGTVIGMIRSFAALGDSGTAGASELAVGISEALYNTATGIAASAFALVMYNIFMTKIDSINYSIDESGFTLTQSFSSLYK